MEDNFQKFTIAMLKVYYCWHHIAYKELSKYDLKGPHCLYLVGLYDHPEGLTVTDFCDHFFRDKSDVSRMMKILIDGGYVYREGKYRGVYKLTPSGEVVAKEVVDTSTRIAKTAGKDLSDEDRNIFYRSLDSIIENLDEICEEEGEDEHIS